MATDPPEQPDYFPSEEELDQFMADWEAVDRAAAGVLRDALGEHRGVPAPVEDPGPIADGVRRALDAEDHPCRWVRNAVGPQDGQLPDDEVELLLRCTAATISPVEETGLPAEEEASLISLDHADWLGAVVGVVRKGPGADASPGALVAEIAACPEVESGEELEDEAVPIEAAFWILVQPWEMLGVVDRDQRLTTWGAWVMPRALARAWRSDFDSDG